MKTPSLQTELAPRIAPVVLANISTRYPYHDSHLFVDGDPPFDPISAHPAFGNSFDWHSSVHSHWTALQLLAHFATVDDAPSVAGQLREAVARNLTAANVAAESDYLRSRPSYERPYGWAWALRLATSGDAPPRSLAHQLSVDALRWLEMLPMPVRHGVHGNTAYALGLMLDASRSLAFVRLEDAIRERARAWFGDDRRYPADWERSGHDFLSPGLAEADLMRRVFERGEFCAWWRAFMSATSPDSAIYEVAAVPNVRDGQLVHLHGLNLSRAGMLARIAEALRPVHGGSSADGEESRRLLACAHRLYAAASAHAVEGDYLSTHWLPTFAWDAATGIDAGGESP
jgi:hypothetical protein